jgi:hypothetical protein
VSDTVWVLDIEWIDEHGDRSRTSEFFSTRRDAIDIAKRLDRMVGPGVKLEWEATAVVPYPSFLREVPFQGLPDPDRIARDLAKSWGLTT